jgi:hypothetical protein
MSFQVTTAFVREYSANFEHLYQQAESMLEGTVRRETQNAEFKFWDFIGPTSVTWDRPRAAPTSWISTPHSRRRCSLRTATWADTTDDIDVIQMLKDPTSDYVKAGVMAMHRAKDERILEGLGATAYTGKEGSVAVTLYSEAPSINPDGGVNAIGTDITNATGTGLTLAKIAAAGKLMDDASIPSSDRHIVANTDQKWLLLGSTKVTNSDYNTVKALVDGKVDGYMGFTFHWLPRDRFTLNATCTTTACFDCFAYHKQSVMLASAIEIKTRISELPDFNYTVQAWAETMYGVTRLQGPGVIKMALAATPTLDFSSSNY